MKIGFVGFGEAAYCISCGLAENGVSGIIAYDKMQDDAAVGKLIHERASAANVALKASAVEVAAEAELLFVAVQSSFAMDVCKEVRTALRPGQIYADLSASSPTTKENVWELLADTGVLFADAAMMGLLPVKRHEVPITASGNGAQALYDAVTPIGMKITLAGERPGAASAIKLIRSVYMKGYDSLIFEMLRAAESYGVFDEIIDSVGASMDGVPFKTLVEWVFPGLGIHAARRAAEMKGTLAMLEERGIDGSMTAGIKHQLEMIAEMDLNGVYQGGWPESADRREVYHYVNDLAEKKE